MNVVEICISFLVAVFGLGYPILFQVISKLDERYSSTVIIELFRDEKEYIFFRYSLYVNLIVVGLYLLDIFLISLGFIAFYTSVYTTFLVAIVLTTSLLVFSFVLFVNKLLRYYVPNDLLSYLLESEDRFNEKYFNAISEVFLLAIRTQDEESSKKISQYFYKLFKNYKNEKDKSDKEEIQNLKYPAHYYSTLYNVAVELISRNENKLTFLEHRVFSSSWILDNSSIQNLSEDTYRHFWRILLLATEYKRNDLVLQYWKKADNFFPFIPALSRSQYDEKKQSINRFLEFNIAVGGLLIYEDMTNAIRRMFQYTSSQPPRRELLPDSMDDVFDHYFKFRDPHDENFPFISSKYYFKDLDGISAERKVKNHICRYIALLFLRQYTIVPHLITMQPLAYPSFPKTQKGREIWLNNLDHFRDLVKDVYKDNELKRSLNLEYLNDEYCENQDKTPPLEFLDNIKEEVDREFQGTEITESLSPDKVDKFYEQSVNILRDTINYFDSITNAGIIESYNSTNINFPITTKLSKSAFAEDQYAAHLNFDTVLANSYSNNIKSSILDTFYHNLSDHYLLKEDDLFSGIDRLVDEENAEDLVCIVFGLNLSYFDRLLDGQLTEDHYNNVEIIEVKGVNSNLINRTLILMRRENLPSIVPHRPEDEKIGRFDIEELDEEIHLYGKVFDLNQNERLREELAGPNGEGDLRKKVYLYLALNLEVRWREDAQVIGLRNHLSIDDADPQEVEELEMVEW